MSGLPMYDHYYVVAKELSYGYPDRIVRLYRSGNPYSRNYVIRFDKEIRSEVDDMKLFHVVSFQDGMEVTK